MPGFGDDLLAKRWEAAGATVIVTENGWIGKAPDGGKLFALCRGQHNGAGTWSEGAEDRWTPLGVPLKPWRATGNHVLVLAQRGFGPPEVAQPRDFVPRTVARLKAMTQRPIVVREHPGRFKDRAKPLDEDLHDCWAGVTWASGAAIKALAAGIPVFHGLERWIGAPAAVHIKKSLCIEEPFLGDRLPMFRRLAHAQWSGAEIATGEPIRRLLP